MTTRRTNAHVGLSLLESSILESLNIRGDQVTVKDIANDLDIVIHEVLWKLKRIDRSVDLEKPRQNRYSWQWFIVHEERERFRDSTEPEPPW